MVTTKIDYVLNVSVTKRATDFTTTKTGYGPSEREDVSKGITIVTEVTKIVQKASSLEEVKRIALGLIQLIPGE
jgi:hypothetical protein